MKIRLMTVEPAVLLQSLTAVGARRRRRSMRRRRNKRRRRRRGGGEEDGNGRDLKVGMMKRHRSQCRCAKQSRTVGRAWSLEQHGAWLGLGEPPAATLKVLVWERIPRRERRWDCDKQESE